MSVVALIPARAGSKGLPGKNIIEVNGLPLIAYTIIAALDSQIFETVVVSSDSDEILEIAARNGASPLKRPSGLAQDDTASKDVVLHFLEEHNKSEFHVDDVALLQPTSPLRNSTHIKQAWDNYCESRPCTLISTYVPDEDVLKAFIEDDSGVLHGAFGNEAPFTPRQLLPKVVMPNGGIYMFSAKNFLECCDFPRLKLVSYEMSKEDSLDIDDWSDLEQLRSLLVTSKNNVF